MSVTPEQVDQLLSAAQVVGEPNQTPATLDQLKDQDQVVAALKSPSGSPEIAPTITGPTAASSTNAAPTPDFRGAEFRGTFADKLAAASSSLIKGGVDPMTALVAGSLHALSPDTPFGTTPMDTALRADRSVPTTPPPTPPSNAQRVVRGVEAGLGDIAAATEGGPEGGGIMGAFRVARAATTRRREEQENAIKMATANTQMLHEQMLIHRLGEEEVEKSAAAGRQALDEALMAPGAEVLSSNKTSDELTKMITSKAVDPSRDAVFLTGRRQVGQDKNGVPIMQSVYTVVKPGGRITPTQTQIDWLNKYIPGSNFKGPDNVEENQTGQSFDSHTWYMLNQRAMNNMTAVQTIQKVADENEERAHKIALEKGNDAFVSNPAILHAFNAVPQTGKFDPFLGVKAFQELQREVSSNPELLKSLPKNWAEQFAYTYGGGDPKKFEDQINKYGAITEKIQDAQHDVIAAYTDDPSKFEGKTAGIITAANGVIARVKSESQNGQLTDDQKQRIVAAENAKNLAISQAQTEAQQKADETRLREKSKEEVENTGSNGSTETGTAFLQTLPPARRAVIQGYIDGTSVFTARMSGSKFGQGILRDVRQAMGGAWDETKGQSYAEMRKKFTTGKEAAAINSANTAMHHIENMWSHLEAGATAGWTGGFEQFLGGNEAGRRLSADAKAVASELGRLYTGGVIGEHDQKEWSEKLDVRGFGMTADKLRTNVKEFLELLGGKLQSLQAQWDDGVPNPMLTYDKGIITQGNFDRYQDITGKALEIHDTQRSQQFAASTPQAGGGISRTNVPSPNQGGVIVNVPDGKGGTVPIQFKSQQEADAYRSKVGLQ